MSYLNSDWEFEDADDWRRGGELDDDAYILVWLNGKPRYVAVGRCSIRGDHMPHLHHDYDLGPFWCQAT